MDTMIEEIKALQIQELGNTPRYGEGNEWSECVEVDPNQFNA